MGTVSVCTMILTLARAFGDVDMHGEGNVDVGDDGDVDEAEQHWSW